MGNALSPDRLIAEIAASQHGVVSGRQIRWAGISGRTVRRRMQRETIFRIGWNAYSFVPRPGVCGSLYAALLGANADRHLDDGPPARGTADDVRRATRLDGSVVLSHWSALRLQRVATCVLLPIDVTAVGRGARPRSAGLRGHRLRRLESADVVIVDGIPTTTVARALIDVAPATPGGRLRRLVREAQFLGLLEAQELAAACTRVPWHAGVRALAASDPDLRLRLEGDSPLAGDLAIFLQHETALGPWIAQHPVAVAGTTYFLDFAVPDLRLAAEADGAGAHEQSQGRTADGRRDARLLANGWLTVRITDSRLKLEAADLRTTIHTIATGRGWPGPPPDWRPRSARP